MGWNTKMLLLRDVPAAAVERELALQFKASRNAVPFVEATHALGDGLGVAAYANMHVVIDQKGTLALWALSFHKALGGGSLLALWLDSVQSRYGFALCDGGGLVRQATYESGKLNPGQPPGETPRSHWAYWPEGEPLKEERTIKTPTWGHDEDFLFTLATQRGFPLPADDLIPCRVWEPLPRTAKKR